MAQDKCDDRNMTASVLSKTADDRTKTSGYDAIDWPSVPLPGLRQCRAGQEIVFNALDDPQTESGKAPDVFAD